MFYLIGNLSLNTTVDQQLTKFWEIEDLENAYSDDQKGWSQEDHKAVKIWNESIKMVDGHYEMAIPFKSGKSYLTTRKLLKSGSSLLGTDYLKMKISVQNIVQRCKSYCIMAMLKRCPTKN